MRYTLDEPRSLVDLIRELRDETLYLLRQEIALAKRETSENVGGMLKHAAFLAGGAIVVACGMLVLLGGVAVLGAVLLHAAGMSAANAFWLGPVLVGLLVVGLGGALCLKAIKIFKNQPLKPKRTIETLKEEREWVREKTRR